MRDCHSGPNVSQQNYIIPIYARPVPKFKLLVDFNETQRTNEYIQPIPEIEVASWALYKQHIDCSIAYANDKNTVLKNGLLMTSESIKIIQNRLIIRNIKINLWDEIKKYGNEIEKDTKFIFRFYIAKQVLYSNPFTLV
jgi:hypothetical protein